MNEFRGFKKGVNLGGWISQFDKYDRSHFETFITKKDISDIAEMGFDHVRVPVDYTVLEDEEGREKEEGYACLRNCREWCEEYGLNMLIDLHECFGYSFDPLKKDMDRRKFFHDRELQKRFFDLWLKIVREFSDDPERVAFEPLNEVVPPDVKDEWNGILAEYIKMIRGISKDVYIVAGGVCYNNVLSVPLLDIPVDPHIIYNFHCYEPFIFTHQGAYWVEGMPRDFRTGYPKTIKEYREEGENLEADLAGAVYEEGIGDIGKGFFDDIFKIAVEKAEKDGAGLYCGEYGVIDIASAEDSLRWIKDINTAFTKYGIGSALWNYKGKDFGLTDGHNGAMKEGIIKILS